MMLLRLSGVTVLLLLWALQVADAAAGFKPNSSLTVNTWTNANDKWFLYPEQTPSSNYYIPNIAQRPNFGIAVSGGGYRAVTVALGYVRALYMMNLTQQARYLSSNSGGSWFNSAFSYQRTIPVQEFIGPYVPPQNLTKDALKATKNGEQGAFAATISNAVIRTNAAAGAVKDVVVARTDNGPGAWSDSIGNAFLAPYELNNDKSTFSATGTKGPIHQNLEQLEGLKVYYYQGDKDSQTHNNISRPFPIVLGSIFNKVENTSLFFSCEFTPEYIGVPPLFPNEQGNKTIGGGLVDPAGFNSFPPEPVPKVPAALKASLGKVPAGFGQPLPKSARGRRLQQTAAAPPVTAKPAAAPAAKPVGSPAVARAGGAVAGQEMNAQLPIKTDVNVSYVVPLKVAAGISSSFLAQGVTPADSEAMRELTGTEELQYWNQVNFEGMKQPFADGGGVDNLAITPLLRRKVQYIVAGIAASEPLNGLVTSDDWAYGQWDISSLFGAVPLKHKSMKKGMVNGMPPTVFNKVSQVFPKSAWNDMFRAFKGSTDLGGPTYHLAEYTVMDNPYQGIHGGWKVKVLWVPLALQSKWEKQLPEEIRGMLSKSRKKKGGLNAGNDTADGEETDAGWGKGELKRYPHISTFNADYSPELTGLLNQQATWQMLQLRPQLVKLLQGSKVVVGQPDNVGTKTADKNVGVPSKSLKSAAGDVRVRTGWLAWLAALVATMAMHALLAA